MQQLLLHKYKAENIYNKHDCGARYQNQRLGAAAETEKLLVQRKKNDQQQRQSYGIIEKIRGCIPF